VDSNSEIQRYNMYPMLHFHRKFSSGITMSSHQVLPIKDDVSSLPLSSRIFFLLLLLLS